MDWDEMRGPFEYVFVSYLLHDTSQTGRRCDVKRRDREIGIWSKVEHPNVLPLLGLCYISDVMDAEVSQYPGEVGFVSPYCSRGNIVEYSRNLIVGQKLELVSLFRYRSTYNCMPTYNFSQLSQAAAAIYYLHSCDPPIIHGDIKGVSPEVFLRPTAPLSTHHLLG